MAMRYTGELSLIDFLIPSNASPHYLICISVTERLEPHTRKEHILRQITYFHHKAQS